MNIFLELSKNLQHGRALQAKACFAEGAHKREVFEEVLGFKDLWAVRHEVDGESVAHCNDHDVQCMILEDLLFVWSLNQKGADGYYPKSQLTRHLQSINHLEERVNQAFEALIDQGFIYDHNGHFSIPDDMIDDAQEFCGVFHNMGEDEEDAFDGMLKAGGVELAAEMFSDIAEEIK